MSESADEVHAAATRAARTSYGRLLALLAAPTRDIPFAEDSLADAFEQALVSWPSAGIPTNPEAWLLTVARNRQRDVFKSAAHRTSADLEEGSAVTDLDTLDPDAIPDKRLELLFACAHPAIDSAARVPLMLNTVMGFEAAQIADAFKVPVSTMAQRLVRAKKRIRTTGIPFAVPTRTDMPSRLGFVLEAIYGAYTIDWESLADTAGRVAPKARIETTPEQSLAAESLFLAVTVAALLETEPEPWGLAALIALSSSRAPARFVDGTFIPFSDQDPQLWDPALIREGEAYLRRAHSLGMPLGRFQLEAAIQSVHCDRRRTRITDRRALARLYESLTRVAPTSGTVTAFTTVVNDSASLS